MEMRWIHAFCPHWGNCRMAILLGPGPSPHTGPDIRAPFMSLAGFDCSDCEWFHRVQMSDLSSFQTTSFHTRLSFLDEENDENLLENEEEDDDQYDEEYSTNIPSGSPAKNTNCFSSLHENEIKLQIWFWLQMTQKTILSSTSPSSSTAPPVNLTFLPSSGGITMCSVLSTPPGTSCPLWPRSRASACPVGRN